ncbi:MAG TPA: class GN sortase [Casimicrobiaceae bacterium]|nr:class GN sortase [Casimicrobiaceae bacterium]
MTAAADRGGPVDFRAPPSNWMRASPPGIGGRRARVESSPVGGGTQARPRTAFRRTWIAAALAALGIALTGHALYIHAKALLAQALLHRAWIATQASGQPAKPWPWADTTPIARLIAPGQDVDLLVLAGATGRTLAFGPGHHDGSALPGEPGNAILSAHRDTHFRFLRALAAGDLLIVEMPAGQRFHYRVRATEVVAASEMRPPRHPAAPTLTLVTCWPFDAVEPGGPLRYVVVATADGHAL